MKNQFAIRTDREDTVPDDEDDTAELEMDDERPATTDGITVLQLERNCELRRDDLRLEGLKVRFLIPIPEGTADSGYRAADDEELPARNTSLSIPEFRGDVAWTKNREAPEFALTCCRLVMLSPPMD
uniref:Uncharacterized protein n=1 Tax=Pristionchus pacificus TaxID=54126 RepID=A0A2A6CHP8_PRIPA|eukprot:PDM77598.1 hypothetical protein PRIPAC_34465 [Pristionchus pacificus]